MVGSTGNRCSNYFPVEPHEPILTLVTLKSVEQILLHLHVCNLRFLQAAQHRVQDTFLLQWVSKQESKQRAAPLCAEITWLLKSKPVCPVWGKLTQEQGKGQHLFCILTPVSLYPSKAFIGTSQGNLQACLLHNKTWKWFFRILPRNSKSFHCCSILHHILFYYLCGLLRASQLCECFHPFLFHCIFY